MTGIVKKAFGEYICLNGCRMTLFNCHFGQLTTVISGHWINTWMGTYGRVQGLPDRNMHANMFQAAGIYVNPVGEFETYWQRDARRCADVTFSSKKWRALRRRGKFLPRVDKYATRIIAEFILNYGAHQGACRKWQVVHVSRTCTQKYQHIKTSDIKCIEKHSLSN